MDERAQTLAEWLAASDCTSPLCRARNAQLNRLLDEVDTFALAAARTRIADLEIIVQRLNEKIMGRIG